MDLAEDGSEDGTSTPAEEDSSTVPPAPTQTDAGMIQPAPTETEAGTTPPALTENEAGTTPEKPTDLMQRGTTNPDRPAAPNSQCSSSDNDDGTEDDEYVNCILGRPGLHPGCKRMWDNETKMMTHHERTMGNTALPIFQQATNENPQPLIYAQALVMTASYAMHEAIVGFDSRLGNILHFSSFQERRKEDMAGGR